MIFTQTSQYLNGNFNLGATGKATAFPNLSYDTIIALTFDIRIILGRFFQLSAQKHRQKAGGYRRCDTAAVEIPEQRKVNRKGHLRASEAENRKTAIEG